MTSSSIYIHSSVWWFWAE